jgi:hypothetical protein
VVVTCCHSAYCTHGSSSTCNVFVDPWEDIHEERNADSFVDDTSNGCNNAHLDEPMLYAELIAMAQAGAQIWEQLLYSSGGALELKKCF